MTHHDQILAARWGRAVAAILSVFSFAITLCALWLVFIHAPWVLLISMGLGIVVVYVSSRMWPGIPA